MEEQLKREDIKREREGGRGRGGRSKDGERERTEVIHSFIIGLLTTLSSYLRNYAGLV